MSVVNRRFHDRAGNTLFQFCHAKAYATRIGAELRTDPWWGQEVFGLTEPPIMRELPKRADMDFEKWDGEGDIEITGWCLHQKCMIYSRKQAKEWLKFSDEIEEAVMGVERFEVAYHLRWGDFQTSPDFIAVSHQSYEKAIREFLPDYCQLPRVICAWESLRSTKLENMGLGWLPDFVALMRAIFMFRANSTFSWWAATLGENQRVFSPKLDGIAPLALQFQSVPFVEGNHSAISCFHPNCSDLHLPE